MIPGATGRHSAPGRTVLLDQLLVRNDVASWHGPPLMPIGVVLGIMAVGLPIAAAIRSTSLEVAVVALSLTMAAWLIAGFIRRLHGAANPYVSLRWLEAARVTFGADLVAAALDELYGRWPSNPDRMLERSELIDAIIARRKALADVRKAAGGVRLSDAAGHG